MKLSCMIGQHQWNGCICGACGRKRDSEHDRVGCECRKCGKQLHDWSETQYYCSYANEYSDHSFGCGTCGSAWECGGEYKEHTCRRCGVTQNIDQSL